MKKTKFLRKLTIGISSAGLLMAMGNSSVMAFDGVLDEAIRTIECGFLLITNPDLHLIECGVGDSGSPETLAPLIFAAPPPPPECNGDDECHEILA